MVVDQQQTRDVSTWVLIKAHTTDIVSKQNKDTDQLASYSLLFQYYSWNGKKTVNIKPPDLNNCRTFRSWTFRPRTFWPRTFRPRKLPKVDVSAKS